MSFSGADEHSDAHKNRVPIGRLDVHVGGYLSVGARTMGAVQVVLTTLEVNVAAEAR